MNQLSEKALDFLGKNGRLKKTTTDSGDIQQNDLQEKQQRTQMKKLTQNNSEWWIEKSYSPSLSPSFLFVCLASHRKMMSLEATQNAPSSRKRRKDNNLYYNCGESEKREQKRERERERDSFGGDLEGERWAFDWKKGVWGFGSLWRLFLFHSLSFCPISKCSLPLCAYSTRLYAIVVILACSLPHVKITVGVFNLYFIIIIFIFLLLFFSFLAIIRWFFVILRWIILLIDVNVLSRACW